jgi:hypothetical protein
VIPTPAPTARRAWRRTTARTLALALAVGAAALGTAAPAAADSTIVVNGIPDVVLPGQKLTVEVVCPEEPGKEHWFSWSTSEDAHETWVKGVPTGEGRIPYIATPTFTTPGTGKLVFWCRASDVPHVRGEALVNVAAPATTSVTASVTPEVAESYGVLTFSAVVTSSDDVVPAGSVQFAVDGHDWRNALPVHNGTASTEVPRDDIPSGSHTLTARFTGFGSPDSTSSPVTFFVKHRPEVLLSLPSHPRAGKVTLTATIPFTPAMPLPTGEVRFRWSEGAVLGTAPLDTNGVASLVVDLAAGTYPDVVAVYHGDESFSDRSSARATLVVEPAEQAHPTPVVTVAAPTSIHEGPLTGTVTVAAPTSDGVVPEGGVQLIVLDADGARVTSAEGSLTGGAAKLTTPALAAGSYTVLAHYSGSSAQGVYQQATAEPRALTVHPAPVTPVVPEVSAPSTVTTTVGTPARLTVALPTHHRPTGDVVVRTSGAGDVLLTAAIPATGDLVLTLPVLAPGTHELLIGTLGHKHVASWGQTITVTVTGEPARGSALPDAQLTGSTTTVPASGQITLVARDFEPGETVVFYLHSEPVLLGTAVADAAGVATLVATVPADVASGAHHVVATGGTSQRWAQIAVTVPAATPAPAAAAPAAAPAAPAATALAVTGTGPEMALLTALALVSGIGLLALRRRLATR